MVFTYLLQSMPLINIHVALAGYADLFLGAVFFAVSCTLLKTEGLLWTLTLVPAGAVAFMTRRDAAKLFVLFSLLLILLLLLMPKDIIVAGYAIHQLAPSFHADGLVGTVKSVWLHDNWHLFGYLLLALIPLGLLLPGAMSRKFLGLSLALGTAVGCYIFLFLFTGFGWGASNFTAVGRLGIQLAPGLLFLCALFFNEYLTTEGYSLTPRGILARLRSR
jgi:hypothetical protein